MDKTVTNWSGRLFHLSIALLMALGLLLAPAIAPPAAAAEVDSEWGKVDTPNMDDWTVAPGSDAYMLALGLDGETIYVIGTMWNDTNGDWWVDPGEETAKLWKSENGGATWKDLTKNVVKKVENRPAGENEFVWFNFITVPLDDSDFVVLAGYLGNTSNLSQPDCVDSWTQVVLVSENGGEKFKLLSEPIEDRKAGTNITDIYGINVPSEVDGVRQIAVAGTSDPDHSVRHDPAASTPNANGDETGLIYRYQYGGEEGWEDVVTGAPGWVNCSAVTWLWFSTTNFVNDNTLLALTERSGGGHGSFADNKTYVQTGVLYPEEDVDWNEQARRGDAALLADEPTMWWLLKGTTGGITLPLDYDGRDDETRYFLASLNTVITPYNTSVPVEERRQTKGTVYTVDHGIAEPLEKQIKDDNGGQPWLGMVYYFGTISEGKIVAGAVGRGYIPPGSRNDSLLDPSWQAMEFLYMLTDIDFTDDSRLCTGPNVYRNELSDMNTDARWKAASKPPTGHMVALTVIAPPTGNKAYCLVIPISMGLLLDDIGSIAHITDKYDEAAFQVSFDDGDTWQQVGLIDTDIDYLIDVAVSPDGNTTYVASINEPDINPGGVPPQKCDSLWLKSSKLSEGLSQARSYDDHWLRLWYGEISSNLSFLRLAPEQITEISHVYFWDLGTKTMYHSDSKGLGEWELDTKSPFDIIDLAVKEAGAVYAASADGRVAMFDGRRWPSAHRVDSELKTGNDIAVLGDNVLVGGRGGDVSYSSDGGEIFEELKNGLPEDGNVSVAFDSYFDTNGVVYAVVGMSTGENGVYRWVIDQSEEWKNLGADDELLYFSMALDRTEGNPQTSATTGGVLYAIYYNLSSNQSGVARCLTPAEEKCCGAVNWDYLERGETGIDDAVLFIFPLRIYGCLTQESNSKLLAIDARDRYYGGLLLEEQPAGTVGLGRLWSFEDCFAKAAPVLAAPGDGAVIDSDPCNCWNDAFSLKWDRQCDACKYDIQISLDEDFTEIMYEETAYPPSEGTAPSFVIANKGLGTGSCGTTYYWRVRSAIAETGQNITSPWSVVHSFTVGAGPEAMVTLTNPITGVVGVTVTDIPFTWDEVPDATGYEFSLKNAATDAEIVATTDVAGTTYIYKGTALSYDTPFKWTVKAMKGSVVFGEATAAFTTEAMPVELEKPSTPFWVWMLIGLGAAVWMAIMVLVFRTRKE